MKPLPIVNTVLLALAAVQGNWRTLLVSLLLPSACILIIEVSTVGLVSKGLGYALFVWAIGAPFYALFAIVVHRTVILGSRSLPNKIGFFWSKRETRFMAWMVVLFLLTLFLLFLVGAVTALLGQLVRPTLTWMIISSLLALFVWLTLVYVYTRLSMLFPAVAVGDHTDLERVWQLTDGNGLRMIAIVVLTVGPFWAVAFGIGYHMPDGVVKTILAVLLSFVVMLVSVCTVSVTYRQLIRIEREVRGSSVGDLESSPSEDRPDDPPGDPSNG